MGKKQSNLTSPMKVTKHDNKKQLNSLIKLLKPKVYITDCLSFKTLVQELTGNGNSTVSSSPSNQTPLSSHPAYPRNDSEIWVDAASSVSSSDLHKQETYSMAELLNQTHVGGSLSSFDQNLTMVGYENIEAWLLDIDNPCSLYDNYCAPFEEVSVFDYELLGLL